MPIEEWISDPIASERHERYAATSPERAVQIALELPAGGDWIVGKLVKLRGLKAGGSLEDFFRSNGFVFLQRDPREVVVGIGTEARIRGGRRLEDPARWREWDQPNSIKAAATFRAEPSGDGARVITETQVDATDDTARRRFHGYWLVVGPFSALIRRRWLRQIARAAERERSPSN